MLSCFNQIDWEDNKRSLDEHEHFIGIVAISPVEYSREIAIGYFLIIHHATLEKSYLISFNKDFN